MIHLLKSALGTGVLAMPDAYKHCGFISGTVLICISVIILTYCLNILVRISLLGTFFSFNLLQVKAEYKMCKQLKVPLIKYPQAMKIAVEMGPKWLRGCGKCMPLVFI